MRALGFGIEPASHPRLAGWLERMEALPVGRDDVRRLKAFFAARDLSHYERRKIFWRGDRIEWLLAAGFHEWLLQEIREGRVLWPDTQIA